MVLVIIAMLLLPGIDAIAKWLSGSVSAGQIAWSRFLFQIIFMAPFVIRTQGQWFGPLLKLHLARGALIAFTTLLFFAGLKYLPIADAISIFFIEPLLVTLLSVFFLGEIIRWRRIAAICFGFIGAMIIIRPAFQEVGFVVFYPVFAAVCFSFYIILTRRLAHQEHPFRMQFLTGVSGFLVMGLALIIGDTGGVSILSLAYPTQSEWGLLVLLGLIATIGHLLVAFAYQRAPVSILAPFQYVEIIGATLLGLILFNDFPDPITWVGVGIIVASGMYVFHRESRTSENTESEPNP